MSYSNYNLYFESFYYDLVGFLYFAYFSVSFIFSHEKVQITVMGNTPTDLGQAHTKTGSMNSESHLIFCCRYHIYRLFGGLH